MRRGDLGFPIHALAGALAREMIGLFHRSGKALLAWGAPAQLLLGLSCQRTTLCMSPACSACTTSARPLRTRRCPMTPVVWRMMGGVTDGWMNGKARDGPGCDDGGGGH